MKKLFLLIVAGVMLFLAPTQALAFPNPAEPVDCKFDDGTDTLVISSSKTLCTATKGAIAVNTDWFPADLKGPKGNTSYRHIFEITCPTATVVNMIIADAAGNVTAKTYAFNGGIALAADVTYTFDKRLYTNQVYNMQHETGTQNCSVEIFQDVQLGG